MRMSPVGISGRGEERGVVLFVHAAQALQSSSSSSYMRVPPSILVPAVASHSIHSQLLLPTLAALRWRAVSPRHSGRHLLNLSGTRVALQSPFHEHYWFSHCFPPPPNLPYLYLAECGRSVTKITRNEYLCGILKGRFEFFWIYFLWWRLMIIIIKSQVEGREFKDTLAGKKKNKDWDFKWLFNHQSTEDELIQLVFTSMTFIFSCFS